MWGHGILPINAWHRPAPSSHGSHTAFCNDLHAPPYLSLLEEDFCMETFTLTHPIVQEILSISVRMKPWHPEQQLK